MAINHVLLKFPFIFANLLFLINSNNAFTLTSTTINEDIDKIHTRRIQTIVKASNNPILANRWRTELTAIGNWTDLDYTHGCPSNRADWKAPDHIRRIITMASLWSQDQSDTDLLEKIHLALDYWFSNDFTEDDCINGGSVGRLKCPCGTPGFWNPNWWYQMILMPRLVGNACLLLKSVLTSPRYDMCVKQVKRSYDRIDGDPNGMMGKMTGANLLDVTYGGTSLGLLIEEQLVLLDALTRSYNESEFTYGQTDGIKVDGSFMQHSGQLLTGSYGSVFLTNIIQIFAETQGTGLEPPISVQSAFVTLIDGTEWFIHWKNDPEDKFSPILLWEYSVIGRSISHKYSDWRGIGFNLVALLNATTTWSNHESLKEITGRLLTGSSVNPGGLIGTRYFHITDYMVHRGLNYIVTLKMFSIRTTNSECYNAQNPFGFHLSDGAIFIYLDANEYTDAAGAWDWNLIPGTTVDYAATPLLCNQVERKGKEAFVGGLALEEAGMAVMNYTNPSTGSLQWIKTFFFFRNSFLVQFGGPITASHPTAPVYTVLDQRNLSGPIFIDGELVTEMKIRKTAQTLWHDRVGYEFMHLVNLTVDTTPRVSNWTEIGSSDGNATLTLMSAYYENPPEQESDAAWSYIVHLDISQTQFKSKVKNEAKFIANTQGYFDELTLATAVVRGATFGKVGTAERIVSLAFLSAGDYFTGLEDIRLVSSDVPVLLMFQRKANNQGWRLAISEPTQTLSELQIQVHLGGELEPITLNVELPKGAWAGSTTVYEI